MAFRDLELSCWFYSLSLGVGNGPLDRRVVLTFIVAMSNPIGIFISNSDRLSGGAGTLDDMILVDILL